MNATDPAIPHSEEKHGKTTCGSIIFITPDTPYIYYRDQLVYFCGEDCKQIYDDDPLNSCMAARLISGK